MEEEARDFVVVALDTLPVAESEGGGGGVGREMEVEVVVEISFGFECKEGLSIG